MIIIGVKSLNKELIVSKINSYKQKNQKIFSFKTIGDLKFNSGWIAVSVDDTNGEEFDEGLVENLSRELNTKVLGYEKVSVVSSHLLRSYDQGQLTDGFCAFESEIDEKDGVFETLPDEVDDYSELFNLLNSYFDKIGFDPDAAEILERI